MKIGILQTGQLASEIATEFGAYDRLFHTLLAGAGFAFETWPVYDSVFPANLTEADGWLITGSRHGVYEDHPWIAPLEEFIRAIDTARKPLVGICFGHQIIAQALGGRVEKFAGGWQIGHTQYTFEGRRIALNAWHQDQVTIRPDRARLIATSDNCENAALAYGDHILTFQPHPEFDRHFVAAMIKHRGTGIVPQSLLARASADLQTHTNHAEIAQRITAHLRRAQTRLSTP